MLRIPEVRRGINIPEIIPPAVSIEKDFPAGNPSDNLATKINLTKVKPDTRQKGNRTSKVIIMLARKEGVCPGLRKKADKIISITIDIKGLMAKIRFIFFRSDISDLPASEEPAADAMSHEPRKIPVISSNPPVIFIISLIRSN